jgi:hypothetical protein
VTDPELMRNKSFRVDESGEGSFIERYVKSVALQKMEDNDGALLYRNSRLL